MPTALFAVNNNVPFVFDIEADQFMTAENQTTPTINR